MTEYPITGTFIDEITYDIPSSNWTYSKWEKELDYMCEVGIDTLVFIRGGFENKMIFPSENFESVREDDFLGFILEQAQIRNMKVFVGLYISNITWNDGVYKTEIEKNELFVTEVLERYGDKKSLVGWYIPHETSRDIFNITKVMDGLATLCKTKSPDKKVLISPFFPSILTCNNEDVLQPEEFYNEWDGIFSKCSKNIDICAFQDGSATLDTLEDYLKCTKELCEKYRIEHWANTETFERDVRNQFYPIPFDLLKKKLSITQKYCTKEITFEFSHFMSPQSIYLSARNLNECYKEYYEKRGK